MLHYGEFFAWISRGRLRLSNAVWARKDGIIPLLGTFRSLMKPHSMPCCLRAMVECASSHVGGTGAGTKPLVDKKRKGDTAGGGGEKVPKLRKTRTTGLPKHKHAGSVGKLLQYFASFVVALYLIDFLCFAETVKEPIAASSVRSSPSKVLDVEAQKKTAEDPVVEVLSSEGTPPAERLSKKTKGDQIVDTLDASDNLIGLFGVGDKGGKNPESPVCANISGSAGAGKEGEDQPLIQPDEAELDYYYRSYLAGCSFNVHHLPWGILQGDKVMNDPSTCRETLRGLGTPVETAYARGFGRQGLQNQLASMLVGGSIVANAILEDYTALARREEETIQLKAKAEALMKTAQVAEEHLEKQKAEFEKLKKTEEWAAFSGELNNLKAANANLVKEKTAAEVAAKEAEARGAAVLKEAEARAAVEELKTQESILGDVTSRATEAEARARQDEEDRDGLATSLAQVTSDRAWMREFGIGHIVEAILDAPENTAAVANVNERARHAGFKAGYNQCLNDVNPFFASKFTYERCGFHGVDTEAAFDAAVDAYNSLTIHAVERIEACLEGDNYVDRLRMLFEPTKEGEGTSGAIAEQVGLVCLFAFFLVFVNVAKRCKGCLLCTC
ncbi:hypothetical protein HanPSC8_Chr05g0193861 [Helianthus annuus]|nr:hypothetical protein HanIR_Chr05g0216801 [Helianthus annuus]KAJ0749377.1 hypothetical protein HanLR1_Chr05g0169141 [Helianthus annuus]KAJ0921638.1 hypothetical protein HanPSC8_Chr05g0193861 [Helianthus annuus]